MTQKTKLEDLLARYVSEDTYSFQDFDHLEVNSVGREMETPLHMAVTRDAFEDVKILVEGGANVNAVTDIRTTPLQRAIYRKNFDMIRFLLERGADPNIASSFGDTPLSIALSMRDTEAVVALLKSHGAR